MSRQSVSIVLPAKNEAENLRILLPRLQAMAAGMGRDSEIIVVDDGSTDGTREACGGHGVRVVSHPYSAGNGAAIKSGARAAGGATRSRFASVASVSGRRRCCGVDAIPAVVMSPP